MMPFAQAGDLKMHYEERGSGPETILFCHGWTGAWLDWKLVMDALPDGFRAIAVDLRGAGETDKPASGYTIKQYSDDLFALCQALGLKNFTFVGHSMGGAITYQFVIDHAELLNAAVPCAAPGADGDIGDDGLSAEAIADWHANRHNLDYQVAYYRKYFRRPVSEEVILATARYAGNCSDGHILDSVDSACNLRLGDHLSLTRVPMLFIAADYDTRELDLVIADWKRVPGAHLQVFNGSNHSFHTEQPAAVAAVLVDFIRSISAQDAA